jgi:hypothetical protein
MRVRRVVTGHTSEGKAVVVSDGPSEDTDPGASPARTALLDT